MDRHDIAHYSAAAFLLGAFGVLAWHEAHQPPRVTIQRNGESFGFSPVTPAGGTGTIAGDFGPNTIITIKLDRYWPALGEAATIKLGEAMAAIGHARAKVFCSSDLCKALGADIDDAMQIAGWDATPEPNVFGGSEDGILVGPPGNMGNALAMAISMALPGFEVRIIDMKVSGDVGIIIGKKPISESPHGSQ